MANKNRDSKTGFLTSLEGTRTLSLSGFWLLSLVLSFFLISSAYGEASPEYSQDEYEEEPSLIQPIFQRLTVSHVEGIHAYSGYGTNYSSATAFISPNYRLGHILPFLDVRAHRFDNQTYSANVGLGARFIPNMNTFCRLIGINAYYDYRRGHRWNYNQLGIGAEFLGERLDFRANMYIPFGITKYSKCCVFNFDGGFFATHCRCESVSPGYNVEVGYLLIRSCSWLFYAAGGIYYFSGNCLNRTNGFEVRIRPQYKDYFAVDVKVTYDQLYRYVYQTAIIISLPLYQMNSRKHCGCCCITDRQIYQPVIRLETMPISRLSCWHTNF